LVSKVIDFIAATKVIKLYRIRVIYVYFNSTLKSV
jgi:hypothetical protein